MNWYEFYSFGEQTCKKLFAKSIEFSMLAVFWRLRWAEVLAAKIPTIWYNLFLGCFWSWRAIFAPL